MSAAGFPALLGVAAISSPAAPKPRLLVIGGTEFIGRAIVEALLETGGYDITLLNRGRTPSPFGDRVSYIICDRMEPGALAAVLSMKAAWAVVVDCIAFEREDVMPIIRAPDKVGRYVMISSDSVYMASDPAGFTRTERGGLLEQSDAGGMHAERAAADDYGAGKLAAERALRASSVDWVALRLPDVFGPHENTGRLHRLFRRLAGGKRIGGSVSDEPRAAGGADTSPSISLVFAEDVATAVLAAARLSGELRAPAGAAAGAAASAAGGATNGAANSAVGGKARLGRAIHICCEETPSWAELAAAAADRMRTHGIEAPTPRIDHSRDTGCALAAPPPSTPLPRHCTTTFLIWQVHLGGRRPAGLERRARGAAGLDGGAARAAAERDRRLVGHLPNMEHLPNSAASRILPRA